MPREQTVSIPNLLLFDALVLFRRLITSVDSINPSLRIPRSIKTRLAEAGVHTNYSVMGWLRPLRWLRLSHVPGADCLPGGSSNPSFRVHITRHRSFARSAPYSVYINTRFRRLIYRTECNQFSGEIGALYREPDI